MKKDHAVIEKPEATADTLIIDYESVASREQRAREETHIHTSLNLGLEPIKPDLGELDFPIESKYDGLADILLDRRFHTSIDNEEENATWYTPYIMSEENKSSIFSGYTLLDTLGNGSMGIVYLARNNKGKHFAIKQTRVTSPVSLLRFKREIEALSFFDHPNIVKFLSGELENQYFVMEYLPGKELDDLDVPQTPEEFAEACRYLREVSDALRYMHSHGIINRDIKPQNIIISNGSAKVIDLGLITYNHKNLDSTESGVYEIEDTQVTHEDSMVGTPTTMAPEYVESTKNLSTLSDVYSLGATAYKVLTGHYPINEQIMKDLMTKKISEDPLPSASHNSHIPKELCHALTKTLERDPSKRLDLDGLCEALEKTQDSIKH